MAVAPRVVLDGNLDRIALLVPASQPEMELAALVRSLSEYGFGAVVVVDDGSCGCEEIFAGLGALPGVDVLRHAVNRGKGRALKTGLNYCFCQFPHFHGVVTADADGQHTATDIVRVTQALLSSGGRMVLGSRAFAGPVPWRNRIGNRLTRHLFRLATGMRLRDTQSGLRGFPLTMLPELMALSGERYEYEMTVLAHVYRAGNSPLEVPIDTVYLDGNRSSRFAPVRDSLQIAQVLVQLWWRRHASKKKAGNRE